MLLEAKLIMFVSYNFLFYVVPRICLYFGMELLNVCGVL